MKKYKLILILFITIGGLFSCDFDDILAERPKDFFSPENTYTDKAGFESALSNIYLSIRTEICQPTGYSWLYGTDLDCSIMNQSTTKELMYWNTLNGDNANVLKLWKLYYNWIFQANVIIGRAYDRNAEWKSEAEQNAIVGEALFIRAWAYHFLANMWGGVPLVLEETAAAKFDYARATQEEVYQQCKEDLEFAGQWMETVDKLKGGRAPRAAANHLLAEVNICLQDYDGAIAAASKVIDDPNFYLMTDRFGKWKSFTFRGYDYNGPQEPWGDVYWDLFQEGNMNWQEGNHEAIWNVEFDFDLLGGGNTSKYGGNFQQEAYYGPGFWWADINGDANWIRDTLGGRPQGYVQPTEYMKSIIWQYKNDWDNDIRNSKYNTQRVYYYRNPSSEFFGQPVTLENFSDPVSFDYANFPRPMKTVTTVHHGIAKDASSKENHDYGRLFKDWYLIRMPETYLLRAEAYMLKGDNGSAASDINVVRNRSGASSVSSGDVDMDLILDERARELYLEDFRLSTLMRTGQLSDRLMRYNHAIINNGYNLDDHINKFPIPNSEIEANKEVELEQNPGY